MKTEKELLQAEDCRPMTLAFDAGQEISGLLSEIRFDREKDNEGKFLYDIRHSDNDWCEPATLEKFVMVNWFGTLIVDEPIEVLDGPDRPYKEIVDWYYDDEND